MRVLLITPSYYPIAGGTETVVQNLSIELNKIDISSDIMTFNMDHKWKPKWKMATEKINGVNVFKIPALNFFPKHSSRINLDINLIPGRFAYLFKKYDILHFHEIDFSFPIFSFLVNKPKILHCHGFSDFTNYKRYSLNKCILKSIADLYISISIQHKKELIELGIPADRITYLPNGIDTTIFCPEGEKISNLVLFVGRLQKIKGLHILLKALHYVTRPVKLVIIGPITMESDYFQSVMSLIEEENKKGFHIVTYIGPLNRSDLVQWYQKAAILVVPSLVEAFGMVNIEALSCGTPVIATPVGGVPEIVQDYKNGILVPMNNHLKLAEALQYLLDNEDIRYMMGRQGRQSILQKFALELIVKRLYNIYLQLLPSATKTFDV